MPLSEREQQILKDIERDLLADQPGAGPPERPHRSRDQIKIGALVFVVGVICLVLFFVTSALLLGIAAFATMVAGLVLIAGGVRDAADRTIRDFSSRSTHEMFGRWEQRFRNRRDRS